MFFTSGNVAVSLKVTLEKLYLKFKETQPCAWFQISGLTAEFTRDRNATREMVTWFWHPGDFLFSVPGFFSQEPAGASIKAITNCTFIYIQHKHHNKITRESRDGLLLNACRWFLYVLPYGQQMGQINQLN